MGEVLARALGLPLPGPVVGLLLLLAGLAVRGRAGPALTETADGLLRHLALLFVPAGVGVVTQRDALEADWLAITVAILVSTALGLAATMAVFRRLAP